MGRGKKRSKDATISVASYDYDPYHLVKRVLEDFLRHFSQELTVLYRNDTKKCLFSDEAGLATVGVTVHRPKRMPDVVLYYPEKNWLFLIDTLAGKGPITKKRRAELMRLFASSTAVLIFCSVFSNYESYFPHSPIIAWDTDVWLTDAPSHMIHYR